MILGSIFGGLGAAIAWVAQGGFMMALFKKYQRSEGQYGEYFALLTMIIFSNSLIGSLITAFVLGFLGDTKYFIILTFFGVLSIFFSIFLLENPQV